ncbi:MAG: ABC transporter permease [Spirochaetia bacterium]
MRLILESFKHRIAQNPLRGLLSIISVALGSAAVILVLNLSFRFNDYIGDLAREAGSVVVIANAKEETDGGISWEGRGDFSSNTIEALSSEYPQLKNIIGMSAFGMNFEIRQGEEFYRIRRSVPTVPEYKDLYSLNMIAGEFLTQADLQNRAAVAVINEEVAKVLFGSSENAIGKSFTQVTRNPQPQGNERTFTITGVFEDFPYYLKMVMGMGDVFVPQSLFQRMGTDNYRVILANLDGGDFEKAKPKIESVMGGIVDENVPVTVWQGSPTSPSQASFLDSLKSTVNTSSLFFGALGMVALLVSSFGIFSIMLVSILERTREVGLRRVIGSTKGGIIGHFMAESLIFTLIGSVIGIGIALLFNTPMTEALKPMLAFGPRGTETAVPLNLGIKAIGAGTLLALVLGTVFGIIPALSAAKVSPIESLRDQ